MFDFGDEFVIESYSIPWLIWVQLLVMILLLIVLVFGFGIFALDDLLDNPNSASSSLTSSDFSRKKPPFNATITTSSCSYSSKVGVKESDERKTGDPAGTSKAGIIDEDEDIEINESSSASDIAICRVFGRADHPCNYFDIVKEVFLKCLGLGESSKQRKHGGGGGGKRKD